MRSLTVRELIAKLAVKNPDAPIFRATDGDVPAQSVLEIEDVPIKGSDLAAVLLT